MKGRRLVRRVFNKQVVVAGGELLSRELLERTATGKNIALTVTVHSKKKGIIEKKLSITELARACGFEDAIFFASQREAKRYILLTAAMNSGEIEELARQHEFKLHAVNPEGLKVHVCSYYADFTYLDRGGCRRVFEDVKGMPLPEYVLKKRWVEAEYGIVIREV
jgi:AraC-like DNA-binding protein